MCLILNGNNFQLNKYNIIMRVMSSDKNSQVCI